MAMLKKVIFCFSVIAGAAACSARKKTVDGFPVKISDAGSVEDATDVSESPELTKAKRLFFTDLQILVETVPDAYCSDATKLQDGFQTEFVMKRVPDTQMLEALPGAPDPFYYVINMKMQAMGHDEFTSSFSAIDGVLPENAPYGLRIRRRPGNYFDLFYLNETFRLQFRDAPVYSFKAIEKRGMCEITHNINLFAENAGYYTRPGESEGAE